MTSTDLITGTVSSVTPSTDGDVVRHWNIIIDVDSDDENVSTLIARFSTVYLEAGDRVKTFRLDPACYLIKPLSSIIESPSSIDGISPQATAQSCEKKSADPRPPDGHTLMMTALRSATTLRDIRLALEPLVSDAMDAAVFHIQEALGVDDGAFAAQYFDGPEGGAFERLLRGYAVAQWCDSAPCTPSPVMARIRELVLRFDIQPGDDRMVVQGFALVHEGTSITNPTLSPDGFAEVDPYLRYGRENVDKWLEDGEAALLREIALVEAELVRMRGGK